MDFATNNPYDTDPAADFMLRPLWKYTQNAGFYKCPGDTSEIISNGVALPRIRTYSMNFFLGGYGGYGLSFEDGFPGDFYFPPYTRLTDLEDTGGSPGAANTFLFIEERQDVINTGNFLTDMTGYTFPGAGAEPGAYAWYQDLPGSYHDRAGGISYCDGHAEIHKWTNGTTTPPVKLGVGNTGSGSGKFPAVYSTDVAWMQSVSARPH
jgi:prepilin-type processing-associated H-X9-DG protein